MRAVILCYYGAVQSIDELRPFYTSVFGNREPSEEYLADARKRFLSTYRPDPLYTVSLRQRVALQERLNEQTKDTKVYIARKHTNPKMNEVISQCIDEGATSIDLVPMSPFFTKGGGAYYYNQANRALKRSRSEIPVRLLSGWYVNETYQTAFSKRLMDAINWLPSELRKAATIIFTSHSQPGERTHNKEFLEQYEAFCDEVARNLGIEDYEICYRSAGNHPQVWLGPQLNDVLKEKIAEHKKALVITDVLSPVENIEVIYDVVNDASNLIAETDIPFVTTEFLNDSDDFMTALTEWILDPKVTFKETL